MKAITDSYGFFTIFDFMIEDFFFYFKIGLEHVLTWGALDHILFLLCLCVPFMLKDWKKVLLLVTFFTLGHTISLLFGAYNVFSINRGVVEFLIPLTILFAGVFNIITAGKTAMSNEKMLYGVASFFGIIHGLAYYGDLKMVLGSEGKFLKIIEISVGVESAQLIVAGIILLLASLFQNIFNASKRDWVLVVSAIAVGLVLPMIVENKFW